MDAAAATADAISVSGQRTVQNEMTSRSYSAIRVSVHQDLADNHKHNLVYPSGFILFHDGISGNCDRV